MTDTAASSLTSRVRFRSPRSGEIDRIYELILETFGDDWPRIPIGVSPRDHLEWKMSSPQLVPDEVSVVELDDRLIGFWGSVNRDVWLNGERHPGRFGTDRLVHPDFQGRGLSSLHREWLREERPSTAEAVNVGVHSNNVRLRSSADRRGVRILTANQIQILRRPLRLGAVALAAARRLDIRLLLGASRSAAMLGLNRLHWRQPPTTGDITLEDVEQFDERADALWSAARESFDFAVVRDRRYLNWRYCDSRAGHFRVRAATRDEKLLGFMVTGARSREVKIVDFLGTDEPAALSALVDDALRDAARRDANAVSVALPEHHRDRETFQRAGFLVSGSQANHGHTPGLGRRIDLLSDPRARIHVAYGDEDAV